MTTPLTLPGMDPAAGLDFLAGREHDMSSVSAIAERVKSGAAGSTLEVLQAWNEAELLIHNAASAGELFAETHPDAGVRERADAVSQAVQKLTTDLSLDRDLHAAFAGLDDSDLDDLARRYLERILRDFRRAGVDRDDEARERLRALAELELELSQEFGRNIREGTRTLRLRAEELDGLPADWLDAHPPAEDGLIEVTTDYPDLVPLLTFCRVRETRRKLALEANNIAWPANDVVLRRLFNARAEHAALLDYDSWASYDTEVKMLGGGAHDGSARIAAFVDEIATAARERGLADKAVLLERLQQDYPDAQDVQPYDRAFYEELVGTERYHVDGQVVRQYFDFARVRQGLLDVTGRLFGLTYVPVPDAAVWHEDVVGLDVEFEGARIGRIYLDLHPREGKYKHAAQFDLAPGVAGRQLPEGVLVCNFSRGVMEHGEVVTLFHEFGHLIHHVMGGQGDWVRFAGVATEWVFVEAPSQMLEEWAWDAAVLATFTSGPDGEPIPAELVAQMRAAEEFGKGYHTCQQMFYASLSRETHVRTYDDSDGGDDDLTTLVRARQEAYAVFPFVEGTHFHCSFGHLDGYSSGYYTYMWSKVISKDLFSAFDPDDLFASAVATRYRDRVLRAGGTKDAADLVADFLGRPYDSTAFRAWLEA